jgi:putative copper resistance protein D
VVAGLADVVLRGLLLTFTCLAVGGVAWVGFVLGIEPHTKPDRPAARVLRAAAVAAGLAALAQVAVCWITFADLAVRLGTIRLGSFMRSDFAIVALVRAGLALALGGAALRLASHPGGRLAWMTLGGLALGLGASGAALSHATARVGDRGFLLVVDATHLLAVAVWVGGLGHLVRHALATRDEPGPRDHRILRSFSSVALGAVITLVGTGLVLAIFYVGSLAALVGTAYGIMILTKVMLLLSLLPLAYVNFRLVRRAAGTGDARVGRLAEAELGMAITVLFAAASLTSLPPAADVRADRATVREVAERFRPVTPRLASPPIDELLRTADPLMAPTGARTAVERAWSEFNHHWAGMLVLAMGLLATIERLGVRQARHWPLLFLGMVVFLVFRSDPRAWPLGPAGFVESLVLADVLQHRSFIVLIAAFGIFEWMVRSGRLPLRPWGYVFPLLCAAGGAMLLTHSHAMFGLKDEFLTEVTHAPLGILGTQLGWARWLELRLPEAGALPGWLWRAGLIAVGLLLLFYREA